MRTERRQALKLRGIGYDSTDWTAVRKTARKVSSVLAAPTYIHQSGDRYELSRHEHREKLGHTNPVERIDSSGRVDYGWSAPEEAGNG